MKKVTLVELKNPVTSNISDELSSTLSPAVVAKAAISVSLFIIDSL